MQGKYTSSIRFSENDVRLFAEASGDWNPLHNSTAYASRTSYGQPVVFGALGALSCLGQIGASEGQAVARLTADFHRPIFTGVDYRIARNGSDDSCTVRLLDGVVPVITLQVQLRPATSVRLQDIAGFAMFGRSEPAVQSLDDLEVGKTCVGEYSPDPDASMRLLENWRVDLDAGIWKALLWSSYFVGMEMPGRDALFSRLVLDFQEHSSSQPLDYRATVARVQPSLAQVRLNVELGSQHGRIATGQIAAFVRGPVGTPNAEAFSRSDSFAGNTAVIIGASRGLGAALTISLAMRGAQVIGLARSPLTYLPGLPDNVAQGIRAHELDAANPGALDTMSSQLGKLDYLFCNAFPAIPALRFDPGSFERIQDYLRTASSLVLAPLCAFSEALNESGGCAVVISSTAVESPVREWPHYVAAKNAIEAFARVLPLQYPQMSALIVRPDKMLTEMTNTPMGRKRAAAPEGIATAILERLNAGMTPGTAEVFYPGAKK